MGSVSGSCMKAQSKRNSPQHIVIWAVFGQGFWGKKLQKSASGCDLVFIVDMGCSVGGKIPSMFAAG